MFANTRKDTVSRQGMRIRRSKTALSAFAACLTAACGVATDPIDIDDVAIEPSPVPAPLASAPAKFSISWRTRGFPNVLRMQIGAAPVDRDFIGSLITLDCSSCDGELIKMNCTSSLDANNATARLLKCEPDRLAANLTFRMTTPYSVPAGIVYWRFYASSADSGLGLPGEDDWARVTVEFK